MGAKRMRTSRQQLIEEPATLADRTANGAGADAEPARELALEEGYRQGIEAAAKLIECGCKALLHGKGECQFPGNCSLEDAAAIRALGTSCEQLNKAVSNVPDQQENELGAHGERERVLEEAATLLEREADELDGLVDSVSHHLRSKAKTIRALSSPDQPFPKPNRKDGGEPCGECHIQPGETCDICGASPDQADAGKIEGDGWLPTHRHKKRGTHYSLIGLGRMQTDSWHEPMEETATGSVSVDLHSVAIYSSVDDGSLWVRPREEFEDGRFETLPTPPAGEVAG